MRLGREAGMKATTLPEGRVAGGMESHQPSCCRRRGRADRGKERSRVMAALSQAVRHIPWRHRGDFREFRAEIVQACHAVLQAA
ncbi:hypothetical protein MesoLjLb_18350 [Mesorhizobium sp. L-8-3]|nr:hypothetical protein MesoLjLb_18350 [Mesorhizobium sp. L-8-3]